MSDSPRFFHREPFLRLAGLLRSRDGRLAACAALVLALILVSVLLAGGGPGTPEEEAYWRKRGELKPGETAAPATYEIHGVGYTEAAPFFARLGFKGVADAATQTLTLTGSASELVLTAETREIRLNGLRVFLGEAVLMHEGGLVVATRDLDRFLMPILRPVRFTPRRLRTIVLDAGHGGNDTGAQNKKHKLDEKVFALDIAQRLERLLAQDPWRVVMTRSEDKFVALAERAELARKAEADLFISIHFNAVANNPAVRGTETYVLTPQYQRSTSSAKNTPEDQTAHPGNAHDAWSAVLGYHMHRQLLGKLKTEDRGLKRARFAVLRLVDCPAVLLEAGYLSNDTEAARIAEEAYRARIAEAMYVAVHAYDAWAEAAGR